jgi:hypothetical protein
VAFEALSLAEKGERGLFMPTGQQHRDGRQEAAAATYETHASVVPCSSPQPFLATSFNEADYSMACNSMEVSLLARPGAASVPNLCSTEEADGQPVEECMRSQQPVPPTTEPPNNLAENKIESAQAAVLTPPQPVEPEPKRTPGSKSHSTMVFLTPKEKYAKEVSAERKLESVQRRVNFDMETADLLPSPQQQQQNQQQQPPQQLQLEAAPGAVSAASSPTKIAKIPLACKILQAKKKMATQKKLILEHGEVRLTHQQRCKLKPMQKRSVKAQKHSGGGLESSASLIVGQQIPAEREPTQEAMEDAGTSPPASEHKTKKIFNRKDKLLAEHRKRQIPATGVAAEPRNLRAEEPKEISGSGDVGMLGIVAEDAGPSEGLAVLVPIVFNCPFCSQTSKARKEHYKHIKVSTKYLVISFPLLASMSCFTINSIF